MNQRFNVSKLLHKAPVGSDFIKELTISDAEHKLLVACRKKVRAALRQGFQQSALRAETFLDNAEQLVATLTPKFWTQGSFAYQTLNSPATNPPQQIDLDDGIYFPMSFVEGQPAAAKKFLFSHVDGILQGLCEAERWTFNSDKATCARITVNPRVHIDIPIYAIPAERHAALNKAFDENRSEQTLFDSAAVTLDPDEVYLALRGNDHWTQSDPMKLHNWFINECGVHPQLRRISRYLKGWRDHTWDNGGPSSITLMVVAAETLDRALNERVEYLTDCQALLAVVRSLPAQFAKDIVNPVEETEAMFPRKLSQDEVAVIRREISNFVVTLEDALCTSQSAEHTTMLMRRLFGTRMPNNPLWVISTSVATSVRSTPAVKQAKPVVPKQARSA